MTALAIAPRTGDAPFPRFRTGTLSHVSEAAITARLGVEPSRTNVVYGSDRAGDEIEWLFLVDGEPCAIWSHEGGHRMQVWSTFGPTHIMAALFGWRATA